jgi:MFS family permease
MNRGVLTAYLQVLRLFSRDVRLFLVSAALVGLAWDGIRAVLFNLYLLRLDYGPELVGVINSVGALSFALFCPPSGLIGTRWGSRNALLAGMGLIAAGFGLLPLAEFWMGAWRTGWLLLSTMVAYLGLALYLVNGLPFMMGATGPEERYHVFSVHIALIPLAAFAGSLLAGALPGLFASLFGFSLEGAAAYRFPLWLATLLLLPGLVVLLSVGTVEDRRAPLAPLAAPAPTVQSAPYGLFLAIALLMALRFGGRGAMMTFFNVYLDEGLGAPTALIGALAAAGQLLSVPTALITPLLVARWGNPRTIFWGTIGVALCALPLALVPHWAAAGFGFVSSGALFAVTTGPFRVFSQELVTPNWRATMASAFMMGAGLAFSGTSLAGGYLIATLGYGALFLTTIGLLVAGALAFWLFFRVPRGELAHGSVPESRR